MIHTLRTGCNETGHVCYTVERITGKRLTKAEHTRSNGKIKKPEPAGGEEAILGGLQEAQALYAQCRRAMKVRYVKPGRRGPADR